MEESPPFHWVKQIHEEIRKRDEIPLFGKSPSLDCRELARLLQETWGLATLQIEPKAQTWKEPASLHQGMGEEPLATAITLTPLSSPLYWVMARKERDRFLSWMLYKKGEDLGVKGFFSETLQEGYYRFLLLEALQAVHRLEPLQEMSPLLGQTAPLPEETSFCIDVQLSAEPHSWWGRLIVPTPLRDEWVHHFATFPRPPKLPAAFPLMIGVKIGSVALDTSEWEALREGDFIPLDNTSYHLRQQAGVASLVLGKTPLFTAKIQNNKIELLDRAPIHEEPMEEKTPTPEEKPAAAEPEEELTSLRHLPLEITVELGRLKLSLETLTQLTPGNTLELPIHPEQGVSLTVNGQRIARGELVYLGEVLGVRISEKGRS